MAVRPVYSADIKFNFDVKGLNKSLANIEASVKSSIQNISNAASGIQLDLSDVMDIGPQGGISKSGVKFARQIRGAVRDAFKGIDTDVKDFKIEEAVGQALDEAADRVGTTSDRIVARLAKMSGDAGDAFKAFRDKAVGSTQELFDIIIGRSIIPDLVKRIDQELSKLPAIGSKPVDALVDEFFRLDDVAEKIDLTSGVTRESARLESELTALQKRVRVQAIFEQPVFIPDIDPILDAAETVGIATLEASGKVEQAMQSISASTKSALIPVGNQIQSVARTMSFPFREAVETAKDNWVLFKEETAGFRQAMIGVGDSISVSSRAFIEAAGPAREFTSAVGREALDGIKKTSSALKSLGNAVQGAFKLDKSPAEIMGIIDVRKEISIIEETMSRMPDKTAASFKVINRQFGEMRSGAIKAQKAFEGGIIDEVQLAEATKGLKEMSETIGAFQTTELKRLRDELNRNSDAVSLTSRNFKDRMGDIRDGITLASETGGNRLLSLRLAMFGIGEATGPVGKLLDRFTSNLDNVGKAEGRLAGLTAKTTKSLASKNNALKLSVDAIKQVAKIEGLHASALNEVDAQVGRVQKAYKEMTTTIEATGKTTPQQVARVREEYRLLQHSISLVKKENEDAIGTDTLRALGNLESQIKSNIPATRILASTLGEASDKVEKMKRESEELGDSTQKNIGIFGRMKQTLARLLGITKQQAEATDEMASSMDRAANVATVAGGAFLGAFGGTLVLGAIGRVKDALSSMTKSTGSQIAKETTRITNAFELIPKEAEVVSSIISDVYRSNLGGSIDEIGEATQRAVARFRDLGVTSQAEISEVIKDALRLRDTYQFDVSDGLDAAAVLTKTFGLEAKQSTEFLAKLGKEGIIGSDALDSILEYSVQIKDAGGNAETLFNLLRTGFAGGGPLGTDKAIDLFKEFRLRISEGATATRTALNEIGLDSTALLANLSSGSISVTDAFETVRSALVNISSETERTRLGGLVMGTQFDDIGATMALSMSTVGTTLEDMVGATDSISATYTNMGGALETVNRRLKETFSPLKDAFIDLAMRAIPLILDGIDRLRPIIDAVSVRVSALVSALVSGDWETAKGFVIDAIASMAEAMSEILDNLVSGAYGWSVNFVVEIANGLIDTAQDLIVGAMNYIGDIFTSYLAPGSPPKKGPLSSINKWGHGLVKELGIGFESADFKFVERATRPIEEHFKKTFGKGGFEAFKGIRDKFTEIVSELNTTGMINEKAFQEIEKTIGGANAELAKLLKVQLEYKKSQKDLSDVQREVSEAEQAGFVSEGLKKKLKAAEQEVNIAKENVSWQEEFLKWQGLSSEGWRDLAKDAEGIGKSALKGAKGAKGAMDGIAKSAGRIGSAGASGIKRATSAIRKSISSQLKFINEGYDQEKDLLKAKLDAGILSQEEYLKGMLRLEKKYVDASHREGLLDGFEQHAEAIKDYRGQLDALKSDAAKGIGQGAAILEGFGAGIEPKKRNLLTGAKELGSSFASSMAEGLLETGRVRLSDAVSKIGERLSELLGGIFDKLTAGQKQAGGIIAAALIGKGIAPIIAKIGPLTNALKFMVGAGLRWTVIGAGIYLIWQNWDKIMIGVNTALEYMSGLWGSFTEKLGGSEAMLATFSGIFENVKTTLESIGTNLKQFVLDALAGESITFSDFIKIFDLSGIDTEPIKAIVNAFRITLQQEVDKIKLNLLFIREGEDAGLTRLGEIVSGFQEKLGAIGEAFDDFMQEGRLGGAIKSLVETISSSWLSLTIAMTPLAAVILPKLMPLLAKIVPGLGAIVPVLGKLVPVVAIATVVISNFEAIWPGVESALTGIVTVIEGVVQAIEGLFLVFSAETREEGISKMFEGITTAASGLLTGIIGLGEGIAQFFVGAAGDIVGGIASIFEAFGIEEVSAPFRELEIMIDNVSVWISDLATKAKDILTGLRNQLSQIFTLISGDFGKLWGVMIASATENVKQIWNIITGWFKKLWFDLVGGSIVTDIVSDIIAAFVSLQTDLIARVGEFVGPIVEKFTDLKTGISDAITGMKDVAVGAVSIMVGSVKGKLSSLSIKIDKVKEVFAPFAESVSEAATAVSGYVSSMFSIVKDRAGAATTFITDKAEALKTFAGNVAGFVSDMATTVASIEFPDMDQIIESVSNVAASFSEFSLIDIAPMTEAVVTNLTEMATAGLGAVQGFITNIVESVTGVDISTEIDAIFAPLHTALAVIRDFDIGAFIEGISTALAGIESPFEGIDLSAGLDAVTAPITDAFSTMATRATEHLSNLREAALGLFAEVDVVAPALAYATGAATPISLLAVQMELDIDSIREDMSGLFEGVDLSASIEAVKATVTTGLQNLKLAAGLLMLEFTTGFAQVFSLLPESLQEPIASLVTSITEGISGFITPTIESVSTFATNFIDQILSIPAQIKEKISEFTDIGNLIGNAFGIGATEDLDQVGKAFEESEDDTVGPVQRATDKITNAWEAAYDKIIGNSIVPDMVEGISAGFEEMSEGTIATTIVTTETISDGFSDMSEKVIGYTGLMYRRVLVYLRNIRTAWIPSFSAMKETVHDLESSLDRADKAMRRMKDAVDGLSNLDFDDIVGSFADMKLEVQWAADAARDFRDYIVEAAEAAEDIDLPGSGNGNGNGNGNGGPPAPTGPPVGPYSISAADNFKQLLELLRGAGIGDQTFDIPTVDQARIEVQEQTNITTNNIEANFPNVTSAQEAQGIVDALDQIISNSRSFVAIGSNT